MRIAFDFGLDDPPGMEEQSGRPSASRRSWWWHFLRHPMPMNLPIETEMPEKTPAFALRRSCPQRIGVRPHGVHCCLPSANQLTRLRIARRKIDFDVAAARGGLERNLRC